MHYELLQYLKPVSKKNGMGCGIRHHARAITARFADPDPGVRWAAREACVELRAAEAAAAALEDHREQVLQTASRYGRTECRRSSFITRYLRVVVVHKPVFYTL